MQRVCGRKGGCVQVVVGWFSLEREDNLRRSFTERGDCYFEGGRESFESVRDCLKGSRKKSFESLRRVVRRHRCR